MKNSNFEASICRKEGVCQTVGGRSIESCPRSTVEALHKTPQIPYENLCIDALERQAPTRAGDKYLDTYRDAESALEFALAGADLRTRSAYFNRFSDTIDLLLGDGEVPIDNRCQTFIHAEILNIFKPAFKARVLRESMSRDTMASIHGDLCDWIDNFDDRYLRLIDRDESLQDKEKRERKKYINHFQTEMETMALASRLGDAELFPWPALAREESNHVFPHTNHDWYMLALDENNQLHKRMVQVKNSKRGIGYGKNVATVMHWGLLAPVREHHDEHRARYAAEVLSNQDDAWVSQSDFDSIPPNLKALLLEEHRLGRYGMDPDRRNILEIASFNMINGVIRRHLESTN